ncbi:MAG: hypothetical protein ACXQS5_05690 [Candidatus Methanospirareceae archaeon]
MEEELLFNPLPNAPTISLLKTIQISYIAINGGTKMKPPLIPDLESPKWVIAYLEENQT